MNASIIICAYNHLEDLSKPCIEAVIKNTRAPYELILVDDGSTDDTFAYFNTITKKAIHSRVNRGIAFSRNLGMALAEGDLMVLIDNDVTVHPGWLAGLIENAQKSNIGMIGYIPTDQSYRLQFPRSADGLIDVYEHSAACIGITREAFNRVGYFDTKLRTAADDTDYCFRVFLSGLRVAIIPEIIRHDPGGTISIERKNETRPYFWKKWEKTWICKAAFPNLKWTRKGLQKCE